MSTVTTSQAPQVAEMPTITQQQCNHESRYICLPPPVETLTQSHHLVLPNLLIDRSIPRCKLCDLCDAWDMFELLQMPDEAYINMSPSMFSCIKGKIKLTEHALSTGVKKEETEKELAAWKQVQTNAISARKSILNTWGECWGIWGLEEIPFEMSFESSKEGFKSEELLEEHLLLVTPQADEGLELQLELDEVSGDTENYGGDEDEIEW